MPASILLSTRRALLAAGVTAVAGLSATPAFAAGDPWFQYDFADTVEAAIGNGPAKPIGAVEYATHDFGGGKVRRVLDVDPGEGVGTSYLYGAGQQWTVVAYLRVDATAGVKRLFSTQQGGTDAGVYIGDGKLQWRPASGPTLSTATPVITAGTWYQLAITRTAAGTLTVYLDGAPKVTATNTGSITELSPANWGSATFFADNVNVGANPGEHGAGQIARLRVYGAAQTAAEVQAGASDTLDVTPPEVVVTAPEPEAWAGGNLVMGRNSDFEGFVKGGQAKDVKIELLHDGQVAAAEKAVFPDQLHDTWWSAGWTTGTLTTGSGWVARIKATDQVGNTSVKELPFVVDATGPTGFTLTGPEAVTSAAQPFLTGKTSLGPGDLHEIGYRLYTGTEYHGYANLVSEASAPIKPDGTFSVQLKRTFGPGGPDLAPGVYTVAVGHCDEVENCQGGGRTFQVTDGAIVDVFPPAPPKPAQPPVVPVPPIAKPAPAASLLLDSGIRTLRSGGRKALLAKRARLTVTSPVAGRAKVEVLTGRTVLAGAAGTLKAGTQSRLTLAPTKRGRSLLRARKSRTVLLRVTVSRPGHAAERTQRRLVLKG